MKLEGFFSILIALFEVFLVITAYLITVRREIPQVIQAYRWQSFLLTFTAVLIATIGQWNTLAGNTLGEKLSQMFSSKSLTAIVLIAALPFVLGISIRWILARATVYEPERKSTTPIELQAKPIWLQARYEVSGKAALTFLGLLALAIGIAFTGFGDNVSADEKLGISVSLLLHLIGLYNTFGRRDVISQMIGILTTDQGMYLAIVKIVSIPVPATLFVAAVYFYTLITLVLLFLIVPALRHTQESIDLDEIASNSELRG